VLRLDLVQVYTMIAFFTMFCMSKCNDRSVEFEDTKEVIRICILKKVRQYNVQKKKDKRTNNDLQNIHIKLNIE